MASLPIFVKYIMTINNKNYLYDIVSLAKEKDIYIHC